MPEVEHDEGKDLGKGMLIGFLVPLAIVVLFLAVPFVWMYDVAFLVFAIGLVQLVWVVPVALWAQFGDRPGLVKGLLIAASVVFLLNATCYGLIFLTLGTAY